MVLEEIVFEAKVERFWVAVSGEGIVAAVAVPEANLLLLLLYVTNVDNGVAIGEIIVAGLTILPLLF